MIKVRSTEQESGQHTGGDAFGFRDQHALQVRGQLAQHGAVADRNPTGTSPNAASAARPMPVTAGAGE